jgi:phosphoglycolate phosphatase/pyrophosphatase PpaX
MLKYKCLVMDHDDTVVQSEQTLGYPYFKEFMSRIRPHVALTFDEYVRGCYEMPFVDMCRAKWNFTEDELQQEWDGWREYLRTHIPAPCKGIEAVLRRQKEEGGLVCVVSLSGEKVILRDYRVLFNMEPDAVYGWDLPREKKKPNVFALQDIMARFDLKPSDLLIVDDAKLAWQMARAAGVEIAFAAWSKGDFPELTQEMRSLCDYTFDSAEELGKFLFE